MEPAVTVYGTRCPFMVIALEVLTLLSSARRTVFELSPGLATLGGAGAGAGSASARLCACRLSAKMHVKDTMMNSFFLMMCVVSVYRYVNIPVNHTRQV